MLPCQILDHKNPTLPGVFPFRGIRVSEILTMEYPIEGLFDSRMA